jgi:hypothetical protein
MIKSIAMEYEGLLDKQPALYTDEDSPGLRFAGPPSLFTCGGKRGLKTHVFSRFPSMREAERGVTSAAMSG